MLDGCGIETGQRARPPTDDPASRSMLDGCGIETRAQHYAVVAAAASRSMLDGCGIETTPTTTERPRGHDGRDRCSMAVGSRLALAMPISWDESASRSMLDDCGIETTDIALVAAACED